MTPLTRHFFHASMGQVHVRLQGNPTHPAVLLLHQAPSHSGMFESVMNILGDAFFCIAPDFPGSGDSPALAKVSVEQIAEVLGEICQSRGWDIAVVFGHHSGASVAAEFATRFLKSDAKLILCGPPLLTAEQKANLPNTVPDLTFRADGSHLKQGWDYFRNKDPEISPQVSQRELASALAMGKGYRDLYQAVCEHDFQQTLEKIANPTLVFAGQKDVLHPAVGKTLSYLKNGHKGEIGNASTYVCDSHPYDVADRISGFYHAITED